MARKKITRSLPPLPKTKELHAAENKTERLLEILRTLAISSQTDQPQAFYALREVAEHYRVAPTVVARTYSLLEQKGILSRIRGSRTVLRRNDRERQLVVRGYIAMPASLSWFITFQDYRTFFTQMKREFRTRGFLSAMVHYEDAELRDGRLSDRLKAYQVDSVLWYAPEISARDTAARLRDVGIRVVAVSDGGLPGLPCQYAVEREQARKSILQSWRAAEIDSVVVLTARHRRSAADEERIKAVLEDDDWDFEFESVSDTNLETVVAVLAKQTRGVFLQSCAASLLAFRSPALLADLLANCRVALVDGPLSTPMGTAPDVAVDIVFVDWATVAQQIVNDFSSQSAIREGQVVSFHAEAHLRVRLRKYAQAI